jgi:1,4-dihydroxy-2-naphthoate octaprenyltransferase
VSFAVAATVGAALAFVVDARLLALGAVAIVAAVTYTGGPRPYAAAGLGEVAVLAFFGFAATVGSAYVQHERVPGVAWPAALATGLPASAILLTNNLRDVDSDRAAGRRTLAVRVGRTRTRTLYTASVAGALAAVVGCSVAEPAALVALAASPLALAPARLVRTDDEPRALVAALVGTARFQLALAALLAAGMWAA